MNNQAKADKPVFEIGGRRYNIVKCDICAAHQLMGYGIEDAETKKRVDWKYVRNAYYQ